MKIDTYTTHFRKSVGLTMILDRIEYNHLNLTSLLDHIMGFKMFSY